MAAINIDISALTRQNHTLADTNCIGLISETPSVFILDLDDFADTELRFLPLLSNAERQRYINYLKWKDARRFLISKATLRLLLANMLDLNPLDLEFESSLDKKPFLKYGDSLIEFNVSHTDKTVVFAFDNAPIGIDVESSHNFKRSDVIGPMVLSIDEQLSIANSANVKESFCLCWTRKEAFVKAIGKGLDNDIVKVPSLDGQHQIWENWERAILNWKVSSFALDNGHVCSIAYYERLNAVKPLLFKLEKDFLLSLF
ncbi:MAG: 4'-phosphopantetheinyl transferase superfamily protein [Bacteroidia bacterium]|nr:4'-phosphopantetheinyl transferase superfamily protein [Bacteroidia bacterium]